MSLLGWSVRTVKHAAAAGSLSEHVRLCVGLSACVSVSRGLFRLSHCVCCIRLLWPDSLLCLIQMLQQAILYKYANPQPIYNFLFDNNHNVCSFTICEIVTVEKYKILDLIFRMVHGQMYIYTDQEPITTSYLMDDTKWSSESFDIW